MSDEIKRRKEVDKWLVIANIGMVLVLILVCIMSVYNSGKLDSFIGDCFANNPAQVDETYSCQKRAQDLEVSELNKNEVRDKSHQINSYSILSMLALVPLTFSLPWSIMRLRQSIQLEVEDETRNKYFNALDKEREKNFKETGFKETDEERNIRKKISIERKRLRKIADEAVSKGGLDNYQEALKIYGEYFGGIENTEKLILDVKIKIAKEYEKLLDYNKAIETYIDAELPDEVIRVRKLIGDDKVKHLDYDKAIEIYDSIGDKESAKKARKLKAEQGAVKVSQKVVHGDEVTNTEIKDSVLNRSNVGGNSSKMQELEKLAEMKKEGLIDEDEFKQMKKEILGK